MKYWASRILTKTFPLRLDSWQMRRNSTRRRQANDRRTHLQPNLYDITVFRWYVKLGGVVFLFFISSSSANIKILIVKLSLSLERENFFLLSPLYEEYKHFFFFFFNGYWNEHENIALKSSRKIERFQRNIHW